LDWYLTGPGRHSARTDAGRQDCLFASFLSYSLPVASAVALPDVQNSCAKKRMCTASFINDYADNLLVRRKLNIN
jgi:hypothetical protein